MAGESRFKKPFESMLNYFSLLPIVGEAYIASKCYCALAAQIQKHCLHV
jgi:uncharacterized membrane protein required for colicin V production